MKESPVPMTISTLHREPPVKMASSKQERAQAVQATLQDYDVRGCRLTGKRHWRWRVAGKNSQPVLASCLFKKNLPIKQHKTAAPLCMHSFLLFGSLHCIPFFSYSCFQCTSFFSSYYGFVFLVSILLTETFKFFLCDIYVKYN